MALIEHLHENGSARERIAYQHVIDSARQSDREIKKARIPQWWKELTSPDRANDTLLADIPIIDLPLSSEADGDEDNATLLDTFSHSTEYQRLQNTLTRYLESPRSDIERRKIFQEFSGAAFEHLAYIYFDSEYGEASTVLSPAETDLFFLEKYPERDVKEFPFGKIGLESVKVPDSLVMQGERIIFQAEFSLHGQEDYYHHKFEGYLQHKYAKRFDGQYDHAQLLFGVPSSYPASLEQGLRECYGEDIGFLKLPFTHHQFYQEVIDPTLSTL